MPEPIDPNTIAVPQECRDQGCTVGYTLADGGGWYAQHNTTSERFDHAALTQHEGDEPVAVERWLIDRHAAEFPPPLEPDDLPLDEVP